MIKTPVVENEEGDFLFVISQNIPTSKFCKPYYIKGDKCVYISQTLFSKYNGVRSFVFAPGSESEPLVFLSLTLAFITILNSKQVFHSLRSPTFLLHFQISVFMYIVAHCLTFVYSIRSKESSNFPFTPPHKYPKLSPDVILSRNELSKGL